MDNRMWDTFLTLLRAGLWEKDVQLAQKPDENEWERLLQGAREQAVTGLLLRAVAHLDEAQTPPAPVRMRLVAEADLLDRKGSRAAAAEHAVLSLYRDAGLHPVVQKGSRSARHYAFPALRVSGDVDLFFPESEFQKAVSLAPSARKAPDGSYVFKEEGVTVELHPRYYDLHCDTAQLPAPATVCGELLLLSAHILKHVLGAGVGLKQLCDMARALDACEGDYDKRELAAALETAGLMRWHTLLCSLLVADLGLDPSRCLDGFSPVNPEPLRRIVREGGNFGQATEKRQKALHSGSAFARKASTAFTFLKRLPFSLRIAPRETRATIRELIRGNL